MTTVQTQRKPEEIAAYRVDRGGKVAERLKTIASGSKVASAVAFRLEECTTPENTWIARDLHTEDGESYDGTGNLFGCGSKLCVACQAAAARKSRKRAREVIRSHGNGDYYTRWRSLVLTMPKQPGETPEASIKIINRAFTLLRKRKFWTTRVKAGFKGVEFTVSDDGVGGFHVHIHLLVFSEFLPVDADVSARFERLQRRRGLFISDLRSEWSSALEEAGIDFIGFANVAVYDVRNQGIKARGNKEISLDKALMETTKYITKNESWDKVSDESLVRIAEVKKFPRMFEVIGRSARQQKTSAKVENAPTIEDGSLLDRKQSNDGEGRSRAETQSNTWRELLKEHEDFETWKRIIKTRINRIRAFRRASLVCRFGAADFTLLNGETFGAAI